MNRKPTALDLFSGCGGMTVGLKRAGFEVIGAIDNDPIAVETYRSNHPEVRIWDSDIRKLDARHVKESLGVRAGKLDLLAGCPPCQGFSRIRTLNRATPVKDRRNKLILDMLRFVEALKPRAVLFENVPGLERNYRFAEFRRRLGHLGYSYKSAVVDAADYGVPQRRRRLLLVAVRTGSADLAAPCKRRKTVRKAIGHLGRAGASGDSLHDIPEKRSRQVANRIRSIPPDGGSRRDVLGWRRLACHRRCDGFKDVYGRLSWDDVAPTITGGCVNPSKGRFLHPRYHRSITLREAALIQSFPPNYGISLSGGKFKAADLVGNALPPELVKRHALHIRRRLL